jgi:glutamine synthetase adenylyltransferase
MVWIILQALAAWIQVVWRRKNERRPPATTTIIVALGQLGQSELGADSGAVLIEPVHIHN